MKKGFKMTVKTDKKILDDAINSGCKTAAELALYVKRRNNLQAAYGKN